MSYLLEHDATPAYQITETASQESRDFMNALWNEANRKSEALSLKKSMNIGQQAWKLNPNQPWKDMRVKVATAIEMGRLPLADFVLIQSAGTLASQMITPAPKKNNDNVDEVVAKVLAAIDARDAQKQDSKEEKKG
mgnify:CR=1 FL=1|tara:strand:+ start:376 stop:783 length:408 start_codon:yes stop_codon:yes gene_type:complete